MNEKIDNEISCPDCGGDDLQKYGTTKAGLQKYRCSSEKCRRQFVAGSDHRINSDTKEKVIKLLSENVHPKTIHKIFNDEISLRWIYSLRRKLKAK